MHSAVVDHFIRWYQEAFLHLNVLETKEMRLIKSKQTSINVVCFEIVDQKKCLATVYR